MTRPTLLGRSLPPLNSGLGGGTGQPGGSEPTPDCCDTGTTPPDRADDTNGGAAVTLSGNSGTPVFVQGVADRSDGSYLTDITLGAAPTSGNVLLLGMHDRTTASASMNVPTGWQTLVTNDFTTSDLYGHLVAWKLSDGTETTVTFSNATPTASGAPETAWIMEFSGFTGVTLDTSAVADITADSTAAVPSITPTATTALIIAALAKQPAAANPGPQTLTGYTVGADSGFIGTGNRHRMVAYYRIETPASGSYSGTLSNSGDASDDSNIIHFALTCTAAAWVTPAPATNDGDDTTYETISGSNVLRIDLGSPFRILSSRLRIGTQNAGSRTYTIRAANEVDFSDAVTITSFTFNAVGSYAAQDITTTWYTDESYQFWELTGDSETRRIFAWELREGTLATNHQHSLISLSDISGTPNTADVLAYSSNTGLWQPRSTVHSITADGSNAIAGPFVNFASGSNILFSFGSNTLTIHSTGTGGGGLADHGALSGLADDDHPQYLLRNVLTAKGDLFSRTSSHITRVAAGSNGLALMADSNVVEGVRWGRYAGEVLITDTPAGSPLIFADLMQNEDQTDLLYEDP